MNAFCNNISNMAIKSILYEVASSPKPGLVDRHNPGAHKDMDFFTFLSSGSVLGPYFYNCTNIGINFKGQDYTKLLIDIRPIGIKAEEDMFRATGGINTHKGMIFSLGIIAAAAGSLFKENNKKKYTSLTISNRIKLMTKGITEELKGAHNKENLTYGEKLFLKYGFKGIRGEVEDGFISVLKYSLPVFGRLLSEKKYHINDIMVETLIHLMANVEDSNILGRHSIDMLYYSQKQAKKALELGGYLSEEGRSFIKEMDEDFIEKNISPGGAADLLAVTLMLYLIENGDII
ncbi:triphosphoribosyl-dephospho-CoA synthase CitG [Wansuia hejianensis]|nr:triphosphoribosyl-dephospho-CoA synthase CitG [Wansuia hejianensis]